MMSRCDVRVVLPGGREVHVGELSSERVGTTTRMLSTFAYEDEYLADVHAYALSSELPLVRGPQETPVHRDMFMCFEDAGPDSWGRALISEQRKKGSGRPSTFEYLLAVDDSTRQGAIRLVLNGEYQRGSDDTSPGSDVDWNELVRASDRYAEGVEVQEALSTLLRYNSSSPGGARPKSNVTIEESLWLAKLPANGDRWDVEQWEAISAAMARNAGITVANFRHHKIRDGRSIFLSQRFDRAQDGTRLGYMSARTLLRLEDFDFNRGSYQQLAGEIRRVMGTGDFTELFRRVAFTLLINNTDDHMRNIGFLRGEDRWTLAPAFDMNPMREPSEATPLHRDGDREHRNIRELVDMHDVFELSRTEAQQIITSTARVTQHWADYASKFGVKKDQLAFFAPMFEHQNLETALAL